VRSDSEKSELLDFAFAADESIGGVLAAASGETSREQSHRELYEASPNYVMTAVVVFSKSGRRLEDQS
jgi:hypothetical protein